MHSLYRAGVHDSLPRQRAGKLSSQSRSTLLRDHELQHLQCKTEDLKPFLFLKLESQFQNFQSSYKFFKMSHIQGVLQDHLKIREDVFREAVDLLHFHRHHLNHSMYLVCLN
jgi:hypothetical protein